MSDQCLPEEWAAFWKIGQIRALASPGFAAQVNLARAEGLLVPILEGDLGSVEKLASELLAALSAQIHSKCQLISDGRSAKDPELGWAKE